MSNLIISATGLENRLGRYLESELQVLEDELWALRARQAEQEGYLGTEETMRFLEGTVNVENS
jgi:hypothetical protein